MHRIKMKVPVVETKDFIIYLEDDNGKTFIHSDALQAEVDALKGN